MAGTTKVIAFLDNDVFENLLLFAESRRLLGLGNGRIISVALRELFDGLKPELIHTRENKLIQHLNNPAS